MKAMPWSFEICALYSVVCTSIDIIVSDSLFLGVEFKCIPTDQTKYHCSCDKLKLMMD